jgi:hypothetical protein
VPPKGPHGFVLLLYNNNRNSNADTINGGNWIHWTHSHLHTVDPKINSHNKHDSFNGKRRLLHRLWSLLFDCPFSYMWRHF